MASIIDSDVLYILEKLGPLTGGQIGHGIGRIDKKQNRPTFGVRNAFKRLLDSGLIARNTATKPVLNYITDEGRMALAKSGYSGTIVKDVTTMKSNWGGKRTKKPEHVAWCDKCEEFTVGWETKRCCKCNMKLADGYEFVTAYCEDDEE